jgi:AraC-like DNA-binding protein
MANKVGRPEKEFDWKLIDSILQFGARLIDCCEMLEVSEDTVQRKIKSEFDCTFSEYRERKMSKMRMKLLQKQFDVAMSGNVALLIWLGKQHLGQVDKQEAELKSGEIKIILPTEKANDL